MKPPDLLELGILTVLQDGPAHGYLITRRLQAKNPDLVRVTGGSLYPRLHTLRDSGCLLTDTVRSEKGPPRQVYLLSESGLRRLKALQEQLERSDQAWGWLRGPGRAVLP